MRRLAIDHGEQRIGLAISEASFAARPLTIVRHVSRAADAQAIADLAAQHAIDELIIGLPLSEDATPADPGPRARSVQRFGAALAEICPIPIVYWDESLSTQDAHALRRAHAANRRKVTAPVDAEAAAVILQSYLDAQRQHHTE